MAFLITLLVVALVVAAFAAASETSLTSVSRIRIRSLADEGHPAAKLVLRLHNDPNTYLTTILTLNTGAVIAASTVTAVIIDEFYAHTVPQLVGALVLSVFVLIFCEIAPKSLALRFSERFALSLSRPVTWLTVGLRPIVGGLTALARFLVRAATGGRRVHGPFVPAAELSLRRGP